MRHALAATFIVALIAPASAAECDPNDATFANHIQNAGYFCPCASSGDGVFMTSKGAATEIICTTPDGTYDFTVDGSVLYWVIFTKDDTNRILIIPRDTVD